MRGYTVPARTTPVDLILDANEGPAAVSRAVSEDLRSLAAADPESLRRYPSESALEATIADRFGLPPECCMVTPGTDAALSRLIGVYTNEQRALVVPAPTFAMIPIYARFSGAPTHKPGWLGAAFPRSETIDAIDESTGLVIIVTPNNPTGAVAAEEDIAAVAEHARSVGAAVLIDAAYVEFADDDRTERLLSAFPRNLIVTRTFSKAWGLAGARVGYALGPAELLRPARVAGGPYTVPAPSLAIAAHAFTSQEATMRRAAAGVRTNRELIESTLRDLGASVEPSQSNSAFVRLGDPELASQVHTTLLGLGISVRLFDRDLADALRITVNDDEANTSRIVHALRTALDPRAILLDIDGVVADVSGSYRRCIIETAAHFGVTLERSDIADAKRRGDANNDWVLTRALIAGRVAPNDPPSLEEITARFEAIYNGSGGTLGLHECETLIGDAETLRKIAARLPIAAVTGRPRRDAERFLERHGVLDVFSSLVCMEDADAPKPDPSSVSLALKQLGVDRAWMVGDTPDDARAARGAGVCPIGVVAPGEEVRASTVALLGAGAGRVVTGLDTIAHDLERIAAFGARRTER
jgi:HAD superfamily hydrolase (TIGR01548 family)